MMIYLTMKNVLAISQNILTSELPANESSNNCSSTKHILNHVWGLFLALLFSLASHVSQS